MLGKAEFDQLLSERERLNEELQKIIDESTEPWGVKVTAVEIKDVEIPEQMQRAIARQAEAERERRAKIINSEGEFQAAQKLTDAADIISTNPASLQLRYLQTLLEIGSNQNTTVVFPLPMDVLEPFIGRDRPKTGGSKAKPPTPRPPPEPPPPPDARRPPPLPLLSAPELRIDQLTRAAGRSSPRAGPSGPDSFTRPGERAEGAGELPLLRGARGPHAAGGLRAAPRWRRAPTRRGWTTRVVPEPLPGAGDPPKRCASRSGEETDGDRSCRRAARPAPSPAAATRCSASRRAGEPDLFSSRAGDRRPRGDRQLAPRT